MPPSEIYHRRKEQELCVWCGKPTNRIGVLCLRCIFRHRSSNKVNYQKIAKDKKIKLHTLYIQRKLNNQCPRCGTPWVGDTIMCPSCLIYRNEWRRFHGGR